MEAKTFLESPFLQYLAQEQFRGKYILYVLIFSYQARVAPLFNKLSGFVTDSEIEELLRCAPKQVAAFKEI